uniref:Uncharacterized protein n=2 Tax=Rubinisphaera brasiliensis TaxID=119 RepID=F0SLT0_RUBBR|nr:hypothetical protein Plabr_1206 [Rubinisphaera brasiliensis DSM 5305]
MRPDGAATQERTDQPFHETRRTDRSPKIMTTRARLFLFYIPLAILLLQIVIITFAWLQPADQPIDGEVPPAPAETNHE